MRAEVIQSTTVFKGRVFAVRQDKIHLPDGREAHIDVVEHHGAVTMIPVDDSGLIWFIRQYRHPAGKDLLELPAGVMEAGEKPEASAEREIREETGMAARHLQDLGEFFLAPGYSTEFMHVFLATGLYEAPLNPDEDELIEIVKIPVRQALHIAVQGQVQDAKSLAALLLAQPEFQRRGWLD